MSSPAESMARSVSGAALPEFDPALRGARLFPHAEALWFNGRGYSYAELNRRAIQLTNRLHELGVKAGDRVAVLSLNHVVHVDLMLAAPKLGFVAAPLVPALGEAAIRRLVAKMQPTLLFCDTRHQALAESTEVPWTRLSDYGEWLGVGAELPPPPPALRADQAHLLLATSGVTAPPKLALLPYRQTIGHAAAVAQAFTLGPEDAGIQALPCGHAAFNLLALPLFAVGGKLVLQPRFTAADHLALWTQHRPTLVALSGAMHEQVVATGAFERAPVERVRHAWSVGALAPAPVRWAFKRRGVAVQPAYGLTEAGFPVFAGVAGDSESPPLGAPLPDFDARLLGEGGTPVAEGAVGELTLGGTSLFGGYFDEPEASAQVLRDGRLRTGDCFRRDAAGHYVYCGRRGESYAAADAWVYPAEIEQAVLQCYGVLACAVFAGVTAGESVVAVRLQEGAEREPAQLLAELRTRMVPEQVPTRAVIVRELPVSVGGSVDRGAAQRQFLGSAAAGR